MALHNGHKDSSSKGDLGNESFLVLSRLAFVDIKSEEPPGAQSATKVSHRSARMSALSHARKVMQKSRNREVSNYLRHVELLHTRSALLLEALEVRFRADAIPSILNQRRTTSRLAYAQLNSVQQILDSAVNELSARFTRSVDLLVRRSGKKAFSEPLCFPSLVESARLFEVARRSPEVTLENAVILSRAFVREAAQAITRGKEFREARVHLPEQRIREIAQESVSSLVTNTAGLRSTSFEHARVEFLASPAGEIVTAVTLRNEPHGETHLLNLRAGIARRGIRPYVHALRELVIEYCTTQEALLTRHVKQLSNSTPSREGAYMMDNLDHASIETYLRSASTHRIASRLKHIMELRRHFPSVPEPVFSHTDLGIARYIVKVEGASLREEQQKLGSRLGINPRRAKELSLRVTSDHVRELEQVLSATPLAKDIVDAVARSSVELLLRPATEVEKCLTEIHDFLNEYPKAILVKNFDPRRSPRRFSSSEQIRATRARLAEQLSTEEGRLSFRFECAATEISHQLERLRFSSTDSLTLALILLHGQTSAPYTFDPSLPLRNPKHWLKRAEIALPGREFPSVTEVAGLMSRAATLRLLVAGDTTATKYLYQIPPPPADVSSRSVVSLLYSTFSDAPRPKAPVDNHEPAQLPSSQTVVDTLPIRAPAFNKAAAKAIKNTSRSLESSVSSLARDLPKLCTIPSDLQKANDAEAFYNTMRTELESDSLTPFADLPEEFRDTARPYIRKARISLLSDACKGTPESKAKAAPELHRDYRDAIQRSLRDWWDTHVSSPRHSVVLRARTILNNLNSITRILTDIGEYRFEEQLHTELVGTIPRIRSALPDSVDFHSMPPGDPKPEIVDGIKSAVELHIVPIVPEVAQLADAVTSEAKLRIGLVEQVTRGEIATLSSPLIPIAKTVSGDTLQRVVAAVRATLSLSDGSLEIPPSLLSQGNEPSSSEESA